MANKWHWCGVALSVVACSAHAGANAGFVRLNGKGGDYLYSAHRIAPGDTIHFQFPKAGKTECCLRVAAQAAQPATADPDATDFLSERELFRYRLVYPTQAGELPFVGIAVIGKRLAVRQEGASRLKVSGGVATTTIAMCTSSEGVHVVSRAGATVQSHLYLAEDYEIEDPTCGADVVR